MKEKQTTVDEVVIFLINDGYQAVEQRPRLVGSYQDEADTLVRINVLHYNFRVALVIARKFGATRETLDFVVNNYVDRSRDKEKGTHTLLKMSYIGSLRRMTELPKVNSIIEFARLGASQGAKENLMAEFVRTGQRNGAMTMAELLGRQLTKPEILKLVEAYNDGGSRCDTDEAVLKNLAARSLGARDAEEIGAMIDESRREFNSHID
ncbi:MAG: hypothetical protein HY434_01000 [Candidatus Liptonbacteria bacterium]|nr:hypothetical protein [Candidatus Liptonbacteria bacterium]